jgi:CdiI immunity protein
MEFLMKNENLDDFRNIIDCFFNQDFDYMYKDKDEAIDAIISNSFEHHQISLIKEINYILKLTENEENLDNFLYEKFRFSLTPQTPGIDMNTYTEFLEYIRDKIKAHLESKGVKINEEENNI